ncbi:hypothetical protein [Helicobacter pylori]|uniref:hypothetical protein n=1 Tax=Helicobacter pylori TaxID=210 RepID=UPI00346511A4
MKKLNITSDKVSQSLINAMKTYKIKPTLKTTLSEAMNNPNLKAFDELKVGLLVLSILNT